MRACVAARALVVVAAAGAGAAAQQRPRKPVDPNDRFAARPDEPELDAVIQIARWLENTAVKLDDGWAWPAVPDDWAGRAVPKDSLDPSLYSGSAGVVLFGLELARATTPMASDSPSVHDSPFMELPSQAAKHLVATLPDRVEGEGCGLYTGIAGVGYALFEWSRETAWVEGHRAARRCVELLGESALASGTGIEWSDCTDVISGGAGIGLFLIHMAEEDHDPLARELAIRAGRRLLDLGEREEVGRSWRMTPDFPRVMPNFSHGTAGIAYFLARLYELTGEDAFLDGALDGARYILSLADTSDGGCRVFHHSNAGDAKDDAEGRALHYMGWCHGPIGTAQLFMKLAQVSGDPVWTDRALQCAKAVRDGGAPWRPTPGLWNNVGLCCGSAGIASFFETLARARASSFDLPAKLPPDDADDTFAHHCLEWTIGQGRRDEQGLRFPQAEHRVKPDFVKAQVGLMQGAAGIGLTLLRFAFPRHGVATNLPDDPTSSQFGSVLRTSLFPAVPAARPNAATTAFEQLGRGLLFIGPRQDLARGGYAEAAAPRPRTISKWFDAVAAAHVRFVMLHTGGADAREDPKWIDEFAGAARARGMAVGFSMALSATPGRSGNLHEWQSAQWSKMEHLLVDHGPLVLLRVEVPRDFELWADLAGNELYREAKIVAPHTLVEFVAVEPYHGRCGRGENGIQRVGAVTNPYADPRYEGGQSPRSEELWPTDVVADADYGAIELQGVVGPYLRRLPSPSADGPWRLVDGRRHYVPLQVELEIGRFEARPASVPGPSPKTRPRGDDMFSHDFDEQLRAASLRAPNVLVIVPVDGAGDLAGDTVTALRELGKR